MERVLVLGPGGAGKSVLARRLGAALGVPVVELDRHFWSADLQPLRSDEWRAVQVRLAAGASWVMDGDLGPYDVVEPRMARADTVVVLDLPRWLCAWRALRRGPLLRLDFWRWVLTWRRRCRPALLRAIAEHAPGSRLLLLLSPRAVEALLRELAPAGPGGQAGGGRSTRATSFFGASTQ